MTASAPPPALNVSQVLHTASQLFRATLPKCLPFAMLSVLAQQLANIYWLATGHQVGFIPPDDSTYDVLVACGWVVQGLLFAAMMLRQRAIVTGATVDAHLELAAAFRRLPALIGMMLLSVASVVLGIILLVAPGIFLLVCYSVLMPLVLFEGIGPYRALLRSVQLIRPVWWHALTALFFAVIAILICAFTFALAMGIVGMALGNQGPAYTAVETAALIGFAGVAYVFWSALMLVLHSAASSSA